MKFLIIQHPVVKYVPFKYTIVLDKIIGTVFSDNDNFFKQFKEKLYDDNVPFYISDIDILNAEYQDLIELNTDELECEKNKKNINKMLAITSQKWYIHETNEDDIYITFNIYVYTKSDNIDYFEYFKRRITNLLIEYKDKIITEYNSMLVKSLKIEEIDVNKIV